MIFLELKRLYNGPFDGHPDRPVTPWSKHELGEVPDGHFAVSLGTAAVRRQGTALTVLAYGTMVYVAEAAVVDTGVDAKSSTSWYADAARSGHNRSISPQDG